MIVDWIPLFYNHKYITIFYTYTYYVICNEKLVVNWNVRNATIKEQIKKRNLTEFVIDVK